MKRKHYSNEEIAVLILKAVLTDAVVTQFCKQHGFSRSFFYTKKKAVLAPFVERMG